MSSKILKPIAIGAGIIAIGIATGGIGIAPGLAATSLTGAVGATLTTTALGGALLTAGASSILAGASAALQKGPKAASISAIDRLQASINPSAPRKVVFGSTALATDIRYVEPSGANQEYIDYIIVVAAHAVQSIDQIWLEDGLAWSTAGGVTSKYAGYLTVQTRLEGSASNTISINGGSKWGASRRLTGCAYVHLRIKRTGNSKKAESPFASAGLPSRMTIVGKGLKLYDPRRDSTVPGGSGPMRIGDQSTWRFVTDDGAMIGQNVALQALAYQVGWRINGKLSVGRGIPSARIDLQSYITAANLCDEGITRADGSTERRYIANGVFTENDDPGGVLDALALSANSVLRDSSGRLAWDVRHNDLAVPLVNLTDDDVLSGFTWDPVPKIEQTYNAVRGQYCDPSANSLYQLVDYPEIRIPSVDGIDRVMTLDLPLIDGVARAQRIAKQALQRQQYRGSFAADFGARAWNAQVGDVVTLTFSALGWVNKLFRITDQAIRIDGTCPMTLEEENAQIYAWDREDSAGVQAGAPNVYDPLNSPLILAVDDAAATADWPRIADPDGTKPDNNANNTADPAAKIGPDRTVSQLLADVEAALAGSGADTSQIAETLARIQQAARQGLPNLAIGGDFSEWPGQWQGRTDRYTVLYGTDNGNVLSHVFQGSTPGDETVWLDVPVRPGMPTSFSYEGSAFGDGVDAENCRIVGQWLDGAKGPLTFHSDLRPTVMPWTGRNASAVVTSPLNTAYLRLTVVSSNSGAGFHVARLMVQAGPATAWRDDASQTKVTRQVTQLEGDSAAYAEAINVLTAQVNGFTDSGLKRTIATISDRATAAADAATAVAQRVSTTEATLRQGSPNLFVSGDLRNGLTGWQGAIDRYDVLYGTDNGNVLRHLPRGAVVGDETIWYDTSVNAGTAYSGGYEGLAFGPYANGCRIVRQWLNASKAGLGFLPDILPTGGWAVGRHAAAAVVAPPGAAYLRTTVVCPNSGSDFYLTRIMVQVGEATAWRDDAGALDLQAQVKRAEAAVVTESEARADFEQRAIVRFGNVEGEVSETAGAIATIGEKVTLYWQVVETAPDGTARVALVNDSGKTTFLVEADNIFFNGRIWNNGVLLTDGLADNAVIGLWSASAAAFEASNTLSDMLVLTITTTGKPILIQVGGQADNSNTEAVVALYRDGSGNQIMANRASQGRSIAMVQRLDLPAGTYTFRLKASSVAASAGGGMTPAQPGTAAYIIYPALIIQEVKK